MTGVTNDLCLVGLDVGNAFIDALLVRAKPYCSGEESMRSLAVILAA